MNKKGNIITAHVLALEICEREGFRYEDAHTFAKDLLCRRVDGQALAAQEKQNDDPEYIKHQKQHIRRWYMYLAEKMGDNWDRDQEYRSFIWEVVRAPWFDEKANMVLDQMEKMLDGSNLGREFIPGEDELTEGIMLRTIIYELYLRGRNTIKTDDQVMEMLFIKRSTYYKKKKDAITLFAVIMWVYAKRREQEDIEKGIVPPREDRNNKDSGVA
ncbi:hypothetical protein D6855_14120 [Butyrivibrio sp. CB08]|uniref:hypothetical protein n=1 Tax=Butyrivibrio sp. CB08 TaxID=2364879 RepID=UPI000EAA82A8|nr:hypothetical protein [Butyrivibrio sp. CB08]RKM56801.1 hypothetical protein D6855_14120 [Butyrivibrio sp. CB08]